MHVHVSLSAIKLVGVVCQLMAYSTLVGTLNGSDAPAAFSPGVKTNAQGLRRQD